MNIQNTLIEPGQSQAVRFNVGRLPSGTNIYLQVHAYRSKAPGPTVLFMAGLHGDEVNSVEIVRRAIASRMFEGLLCGAVLAVPLLNVYGFNNFSRDVPDGKDVNRSFPGTSSGSLASRVAYFFTKNILPQIDFGVDFHTGGNSNYNYPQIRYSAGDARSEELAAAFAAPFSIATAPIAKSLRRTALNAGRPIVVFEGGENLRFDGFSIEKGLAGIRRLLHTHGMLPAAPPSGKVVHIAHRTWVRAARPGIFCWSKSSGQQVRQGEPLAMISDPNGTDDLVVVSPKDGYIIGHNNNPVVGVGDALFHIGS